MSYNTHAHAKFIAVMCRGCKQRWSAASEKECAEAHSKSCIWSSSLKLRELRVFAPMPMSKSGAPPKESP